MTLKWGLHDSKELMTRVTVKLSTIPHIMTYHNGCGKTQAVQGHSKYSEGGTSISGIEIQNSPKHSYLAF